MHTATQPNTLHLRIRERHVQQVVDEVNPRLHRDGHAVGQVPPAAEARVPRAGVARSAAVRVAPDVVGVEADQVPEPVGHEDGAHIGRHHVVDGALQQARGFEALAGDSVGQFVERGPRDAFVSERGEKNRSKRAREREKESQSVDPLEKIAGKISLAIGVDLSTIISQTLRVLCKHVHRIHPSPARREKTYNSRAITNTGEVHHTTQSKQQKHFQQSIAFAWCFLRHKERRLETQQALALSKGDQKHTALHPTPLLSSPLPSAAKLTRLHGVHDLERHIPHRLEDHSLVGRELSVRGERARDVAGVAVVLAAHVQE